MRTYPLLLIGLLLAFAEPVLAQSVRTQRETIVIKRSGSGSVTVDISDDGIYVNGERVATRAEVNNRNLTKRIIVEDGDLGGSDTRPYDDYYNSGTANDPGRAVLGVYSGPNRSNSGAIIQSVTRSSGAERGGLRSGDIITRVDTINIYDSDDLTRAIRRYDPGDRVTINYSRNGRDRQTTVTLGEADRPGWSRIYESNDPWRNEWPRRTMDDDDVYSSRPKLGVAVEELANGKGVRILSVKPYSPAEAGGLRSDDVITSIDGIRVDNIDDLQRVVGNLKEGNSIRLNIIRSGDRISKMVTMPKPKDIRDF